MGAYAITNSDSEREHIYINCLTYLAAEAEREQNFIIAGILKSASADIYDWMHHGHDEPSRENEALIESFTAACLFVLRSKTISKYKKDRIISMLSALEKSKFN